MAVFVGPCPEGMEVCHRDGNASNNNLANLRYGTPVSNAKDKIEHGTLNRGERNGQAKLTEDAVKSIKSFLDEGWHQWFVAKLFGVSRAAIGLIVKGKNWSHVS
jgi:hypothetical protein